MLFRNKLVNPWAYGETSKKNRYAHDALDASGGGGTDAIQIGMNLSTHGHIERHRRKPAMLMMPRTLRAVAQALGLMGRSLDSWGDNPN